MHWPFHLLFPDGYCFLRQACLFNDPHSGANILIASDAIGLGLNFNI